jgi:hypothetical protein
MSALQSAALAVVGQVPAELPQGQALADAAALLVVVEQLRGACLTRIADVDARRLHLLDGAGSTAVVDRAAADVAGPRAGRAGPPDECPAQVGQAVRCGVLSVSVAERGRAMARGQAPRHVDRRTG